MANQRTVYEWDIEEFTGTGADEEINDHHHSDNCPGIPDEEGHRLVLVRDTFEWPDNDKARKCDPDIVKRLWAYVENGKLPNYFEDCGHRTNVRVPLNFHNELAKTKNKAA